MKRLIIVLTFILIIVNILYAEGDQIKEEDYRSAEEENHYYSHVMFSALLTFINYKIVNSFNLKFNPDSELKRHIFKLSIAAGSTLLLGYIKERYLDLKFGYDDMLANSIGVAITILIINYDIYILGNTLNLNVNIIWKK